MMKLPKKKGLDFNELLKDVNPVAVDLIKRMLAFDPANRITVEQALAHPFLKQLHQVEDEPEGEQVSAFDFDFELYSLKIPEYKELIY